MISRRGRGGVCAALLLVLFGPSLAAGSGAAEADVSARSQVSHTAMYVGDRITFTVTLVLHRQFDALPEDLGADKLKLEGLDAVTREVARSEDADGTTTYVVRYLLTTYRVDLPLLKIAPMSVRYYVRRAGQEPRDAVPAGAVQVPGAVIAFRSVVPEGQGVTGARDARDPLRRPRLYSVLRSIGLGLLALGVIPIVVAFVDFARGVRRRRPAARLNVTRKRSRQQARAAITALAAETPQTIQERREAFARLDGAVREHISEVWHVPVRNLAAEAAAALLDQNGGSVPAGAASFVLRTCELALYGPPETVPSAGEWRDALARGEQVVGAG